MNFGIYVRSKNEVNIIEFMDHYYNIGFSIILFYDDFSIPSVQEVINNESNLRFEGKYKIIRNKTVFDNLVNLNNNEFFIENILPCLKQSMDYCFYVDMDEYLKIKCGSSINAIAEFYNPFDSLKINWVLFGSNGIIKSETNNKLKPTYTRSFSKINTHVKSLTKVSTICGCHNPHYFLLKKGSITKNIFNEITSNDPFEAKMENYRFDYVNLFVAHYIVQGINGFIMRRFGRKTDTSISTQYEGIEILISNNIENICSFYLDNNHQHLSHLLEKEINIIKSIFGFLNAHNGNDEENILY